MFAARWRARARLIAALVVVAAGLPLGPLRGLPPAAAAEPPPAPAVEAVRIEGRDGFPLHALRYRPAGRASGGVLLVHDWSSDGGECWGELPRLLAQAGCEVLVPDLRGHGLSRVPELLGPADARPSRGELQQMRADGARWWALLGPQATDVVLVCAGWSGLGAPAWVPEGRRLRGIVWIDPRGEASSWDAELQAATPDPPPLLFVATRENASGLRIAESLFSRFNSLAELRLYSRGRRGCGLARERPAQAGVGEWVTARWPGPGAWASD
ncbi:MAG: alpha/beta fold hydrolase [Candidatus Eisenbacteria bacterium]|uniref:Alpha/beta fold hydrolase n=1 Tax=Eiseniibacteriota bacterium TaxID=2212470 RepID=A0A937XBB9_UNCEI|nr:alpha/beta fold hydrolase [Candidatus Eisenbacteria bacterium]